MDDYICLAVVTCVWVGIKSAGRLLERGPVTT